jgi:hypothetical protein
MKTLKTTAAAKNRFLETLEALYIGILARIGMKSNMA